VVGVRDPPKYCGGTARRRGQVRYRLEGSQRRRFHRRRHIWWIPVAQWGERRRIEGGGLSIVRRRYPNSARPTKLAEPQSRRDSETGHPHLIIAEMEDGHGAAETNPVVVGMTVW
jgi:hypothetical protein